MDGKASQQPENDKPKADKADAPKTDKADNSVVEGQSSGKDVGGKEVTQGAGAPKDGKKSATQAAATYDLQTFLHISDLAADQLHAFKVTAQADKTEPQSLAAWQKQLQDFLNRPV